MMPHLQYEDQGQERLFDKPRIIMHSKKMLLNLRRSKIHVDDIVRQINAHGVPMTRARFEDLFTSRPQRVVIATPAVFLVFVTVCFAFDASVLTAVELLDFADAARLPLRYYDQLSVHCSTHEWQDAWFGMLPTTKPYLNRHLMVHRDHEFKRALQAYSNEQHIIVSGPAGIGKTAFAHSFVLELEMLTGAKIAALYLDQPITSHQELIAKIAQASNTRPLHNEPLELRIKSILPTDRTTYVYIDNLRGGESDCSILAKVAHLFPQMRFLITTPQSTPFVNTFREHVGPVWVESLAPLHDTTTNSPAMMLFIQTLGTHGGTYASSDIHTLHDICKGAHGIPRDIVALAKMHHLRRDQPQRESVRDALAKLNFHQLRVFSLLTHFTVPISASLLTALLGQLHPGTHPRDALETLTQSNLLDRQYSDSQTTYRTTPEAVQAYTQMFSPAHLAVELAEHLDLLTRLVETAEIAVIASIHKSDAHAIVTMLKHSFLHTPQTVFDVAKLMSAGLQLWFYHDVTSDIILIFEQILLQHNADHPAIAELCVATGRVYNARGQFSQALELQDMLSVYISPNQHSSIWARSVIVQLSAHLSTQNRAALESLDSHVMPAAHLIAANENDTWQHFARITLSLWHCSREDLPQALRVSTCAPLPGNKGITAEMVSLEFQRSLVHIFGGSYDIAKAILVQLSNQLKPFDVPYYDACLQLRLAAISALMYDLEDATCHISQTFDVLKCVGNVTELLFVAEIYSLIQYRQQAFASALEISTLCAKLRNDYGMMRIGYIERLVSVNRAKIPVHIRESVDVPEENSTIYDLIGMLNALNQSRKQVQRPTLRLDSLTQRVPQTPVLAS